MMRMYKPFLATLFLFSTGIAMADDKPLEVTIQVVESPADLPSAVTKTIMLPASASDQARVQSQQGLDTANQARTLGREFGQNIADQAKTRKGKP